MLGIKWSAIDFDNNTITVNHTVHEIGENGKITLITRDRTKTKSSYRTLPLVDEIAGVLKSCKKQQESNKKLMGSSYNKKYTEYICVDKMGNLTKPGYVTSHFSLLLLRNELRHIRFHDLRHSCASLLLARGISIKEIQEWLGHSNYNTTANIYAHLDIKSKQNTAVALSGILKR